jgi:hypothetical protein
MSRRRASSKFIGQRSFSGSTVGSSNALYPTKSSSHSLSKCPTMNRRKRGRRQNLVLIGFASEPSCATLLTDDLELFLGLLDHGYDLRELGETVPQAPHVFSALKDWFNDPIDLGDGSVDARLKGSWRKRTGVSCSTECFNLPSTSSRRAIGTSSVIKIHEWEPRRSDAGRRAARQQPE